MTNDFDTLLSLVATSAPLGQWYFQGTISGQTQYLVANDLGNIAGGTGYVDSNNDVHIDKNTDTSPSSSGFAEG